jgi:hypothetical protein
MQRKGFLLLICLGTLPTMTAAMAFGCGSDVVQGPPGDDVDAGQGGDAHHDGPSPGAGGSFYDGGKDALNEYDDPGCPDAGPPTYDYQCDPYNQFNGDCGPDEGCYIYVQYPSEPCDQETYGSVCSITGPGQQGAACGGPLDCAAGYVCVITGAGTQCVHLCALEGDDGCPTGLVCQKIDVEGFGGCL